MLVFWDGRHVHTVADQQERWAHARLPMHQLQPKGLLNHNHDCHHDLPRKLVAVIGFPQHDAKLLQSRILGTTI
jgi:hypothetical protein